MPDEELLARAAAGDLQKPDVLVAQVRRMLKDERARGLAAEFAGNWLDFRRFEEHNAVDRERFPSFNNELREAMFEEPVRFIEDVIRNDRSVLDLLYGNYTFVNPVLAQHYGMPEVAGDADKWVRVDDARRYGRGGLLPMAVFLTQNAPGLRTSPVKRGYWVVRRVLGEAIPPPPPTCRNCRRMKRSWICRCARCWPNTGRIRAAPPVMRASIPSVWRSKATDRSARGGPRTSPDGRSTPRRFFPAAARAPDSRACRPISASIARKTFMDNLSRKLLAYALGRSLLLSDEPVVERMRATLAANGYRFTSVGRDHCHQPAVPEQANAKSRDSPRTAER